MQGLSCPVVEFRTGMLLPGHLIFIPLASRHGRRGPTSSEVSVVSLLRRMFIVLTAEMLKEGDVACSDGKVIWSCVVFSRQVK